MGLRGPLPQVTRHADKPLTDLTPPDWLGDEGKAHWQKHAADLARNNLLTSATADSFTMLCDLWARFREMNDQPTCRAFLDVQKAYVSLAKIFRLVPCDKPGRPVGQRHDDKDEFTF